MVPHPGPIALVGSGEFLPVMEDVDRGLLAGRPPRAAFLPTAAGEEGPVVVTATAQPQQPQPYGPQQVNAVIVFRVAEAGLLDFRLLILVDALKHPAQALVVGSPEKLPVAGLATSVSSLEQRFRFMTKNATSRRRYSLISAVALVALLLVATAMIPRPIRGVNAGALTAQSGARATGRVKVMADGLMGNLTR